MATYIKPDAIKDNSLSIEKINNVALDLADKVNALSDEGKNTFLNKIGLGKIGVISQKQNWTSDYSSYTISGVVRGIIPQSFIDTVISAAQGYAVFNEQSGYFELNDLTDISYKEMQDIYNLTRTVGSYTNSHFNLNPCRTNLPKAKYPSHLAEAPMAFASDSLFETVRLNPMDSISLFSDTQFFIYNAKRIKKVLGVIKFDINRPFKQGFENSPNLEYLRITDVYYNIQISKSPRLSNESILFLINNEAATSAITITLHPDAYARAMANADILAALEQHTNISLASA